MTPRSVLAQAQTSDRPLLPMRLQLSRRKGWRKPAGSVSVARPTRWGNPHRVDGEVDAARAVRRFFDDLHGGRLPYSVQDVRDELGGRDLMCWCRLETPCHGDVLLEIANAPGAP